MQDCKVHIRVQIQNCNFCSQYSKRHRQTNTAHLLLKIFLEMRNLTLQLYKNLGSTNIDQQVVMK